MYNFEAPAYPLPIVMNDKGEMFDTTDYGKSNAGFTKLEFASLMIASSCIGNPNLANNSDEYIAKLSVSLAKAILEETAK